MAAPKATRVVRRRVPFELAGQLAIATDPQPGGTPDKVLLTEKQHVLVNEGGDTISTGDA